MKIIVTGSPRAGTSFLAGLINRMGFDLGPEEWLRKADINNKFGYFECVPLMKISMKILEKLGGDFHKPPYLTKNWISLCDIEKEEIRDIVTRGNIELYKDNRLLILADLYDELFPQSKWIFIERDVGETYRSRFGKAISFEGWKRITAIRHKYWYSSRPSTKALRMKYKDFISDPEIPIHRIQKHLGIGLGEKQLKSCLDFFRPSKQNSRERK